MIKETNKEKQVKDWEEEKANEIVNHFMGLGATISKSDYDYVFALLAQQEKEVVEKCEKSCQLEKDWAVHDATSKLQ